MKKKDKKNHKSQQESMQDNDDRLIMNGVVLESLPSTLFRVQISDGGAVVFAKLAGRLRQNRIKVLPGDHVTVEISPYDLTRGRIIWRGK